MLENGENETCSSEMKSLLNEVQESEHASNDARRSKLKTKFYLKAWKKMKDIEEWLIVQTAKAAIQSDGKRKEKEKEKEKERERDRERYIVKI